MAKPVWVDDGRRCHACKGTRWVLRYYIGEWTGDGEITYTEVDFHDTCVGSWLQGNHNRFVMFRPGYVHAKE